MAGNIWTMTMTDIVERLRAQAWRRSGAPKMDAGHTKMLEWEAADDIERLKGRIVDLEEQLLRALGEQRWAIPWIVSIPR